MKTGPSAVPSVLGKGEVQLLQLKTAEAFPVKGKKNPKPLKIIHQFESNNKKINQQLTASVSICSHCEICFEELTVHLGSRWCLLLFEMSLAYPGQLHLCVNCPLWGICSACPWDSS